VITNLGHVGLYCFDLDAQVDFYSSVLGLQITDRDDRMVFLSSRPDEEHHELALLGGRDVPADGRLVQQVSFRCAALEDVCSYYKAFLERGVKIDRTLSHGNAIGLYFYDPEGNRCEVYWQTGLKAKQPYIVNVDLAQDPDVLMQSVTESVARFGATGVLETT
jgi:catechol-2,3-dioxygenase